MCLCVCVYITENCWWVDQWPSDELRTGELCGEVLSGWLQRARRREPESDHCQGVAGGHADHQARSLSLTHTHTRTHTHMHNLYTYYCKTKPGCTQLSVPESPTLFQSFCTLCVAIKHVRHTIVMSTLSWQFIITSSLEFVVCEVRDFSPAWRQKHVKTPCWARY